MIAIIVMMGTNQTPKDTSAAQMAARKGSKNTEDDARPYPQNER